MNVLNFIVYVFNAITDGTFVLMSLSDMAAFASELTYWAQLFDPSFIMSFVIWLSVFFFTWKFTYNLFFRLMMHVTNFPKRKKQK